MLMPIKMPPKYRRKTYTKIEKQILMELIEPNLPAITDKRREGKVLFNHDRAWREISLLFNAHRDTVTVRTSNDLRGAWKYVTQVQFPKLPPMQIVMEYLNGRKRLVNYRALLLDASHWKMEDGAGMSMPLTDLPPVKVRGKRTVYKLYEKELLLELVTNRWSDVMLTGPELTCELRRDGAWQEVHDNYNEDPRAVTQRTIRDLRYCWKYMVQQGRQVEAKLKAQQPGDPPFIPSPTEAVYLRVRQLELDCGSRFLPFYLQSPPHQGEDMSPNPSESPSGQGQPLQSPGSTGQGRGRGRRGNAARQEAARQEAARQEGARQEVARQDARQAAQQAVLQQEQAQQQAQQEAQQQQQQQQQQQHQQQQQQQHQESVQQHQSTGLPLQGSTQQQHQPVVSQHQSPVVSQHQEQTPHPALALLHQSQVPPQPGLHHGSSPHQVAMSHQGQSPQALQHPGPLQVPLAHQGLALIQGLALHQATRPQHSS